MGRNLTEITSDQKDLSALNESTAFRIIADCLSIGVSEFCICPGARNSAFIDCLEGNDEVTQYFHYEERSAAFFALGRSKATGRPTAVITTSGTAVGELLPAAMEAYYSGIPLILITADRPKRFRGTGAPQSAEQQNIFGIYAPFAKDLEGDQTCNLQEWDRQTSAHLNVCLEEKYSHSFESFPDLPPVVSEDQPMSFNENNSRQIQEFLESSRYPFIVVSSLPQQCREGVIQFLSKSKIPVYCEAVSGIRNDPRLKPIRIHNPNTIWSLSKKTNYPIDAVLRIGGVPTLRLWRDLEKLEGKIKVCSIADVPFSGLSWAPPALVGIEHSLPLLEINPQAEHFLTSCHQEHGKLEKLLNEENRSEPAMVHHLSKLISNDDLLYLGNSMPIREWDLVASYDTHVKEVYASRGLNGIDGQLSTFLGICHPDKNNWCLLGDLTTLYDLSAPWILSQLRSRHINIVVMNNGGGRIFERLFANPSLQNQHDHTFEHFAKMWGMHYEVWEEVPAKWRGKGGPTLIECRPDNSASNRFWDALKRM